MNKTYYEFYKDSPELIAQLLASAYIAGFVSSKSFERDEIDQVVWDSELTKKLTDSYLKVLISIHPTYYGKGD